MCGIAGVVGGDPATAPQSVERMCAALAHRGPDDAGTFTDEVAAIGMRRLSIIDLAGGHQPIGNEDGSIQVVLNGEIYNHAELRAELQALGHQFRTRADTEVLVHLYETVGDDLVSRLRGMFAFALWDRRRRRLLLGRDHFGQKPLYYTESGGRLVFASEVKALLAIEPRLAELDPCALDQFFTLRFVDAPQTFFRRVRQLPPAHVLVWSDGKAVTRRYWSWEFEPKWEDDEERLLARIEDAFDEAVALHLTSDVAVGAFVSGGLDSPLVAASAAGRLGAELRTFAMGIPVGALDERPAARLVASRWGTQHREAEVRPRLAADLPRVVAALDEPADPLSLCLLHLSEFTARHVKVVLGGDGGDELFGGYDRYAAGKWIDVYRAVPGPLRVLGRTLLDRVPDAFAFKSVTHKLRWMDLMARHSGADRYAESLAYFWFNAEQRAALYGEGFAASLRGHDPAAPVRRWWAAPNARAPMDKMMLVDAMTRLPAHSLAILDRTTMAFGLESRAPFLDPRLAELVARVPTGLKIRGRRLRHLERRMAERRLPPELLRRPKQGFASPLMYTLDAEVRALAPRVLVHGHLARDGIVRAARVRALVDEHLGRRRDHGNRIWLLLSAEVWYRRYVAGHSQVDLESELSEPLRPLPVAPA